MDCDRNAGGASADSAHETARAIRRGPPPRARRTGSSCLDRAAAAQLLSDRHPRAAVAPITCQGLIAPRTLAADSRSTPYSVSAYAIATLENSRYRSTCAGATTITVPQPRHRNRRCRISTSRGSEPTSVGPRNWRPLTPCPTTVGGWPGRRLAAPHPVQREGLTASTAGTDSTQNLRFNSECINLFLLIHSERAARGGLQNSPLAASILSSALRRALLPGRHR